MIRFRTGARSLWTMVPEAEWVGFLLPLSWTGDYVLNGYTARPNTVFQLDGSQDYDVLAENRDAVTVGVRRSVLARALSTLSGFEYTLEPAEIRVIEVPIAQKEQLLGVISRCIDVSERSPGFSEVHHIPPPAERQLISDIGEFMLRLRDYQNGGKLDRKTNTRIVRDVLSAIHDAEAGFASIADLCAAAGVQKSRLYEAFDEVYGIAPGEYVLKYRLTRARAALLSEEGRSRQIKDIAISCGFLRSGQFARAYRSTFGELPSETRRL